MSGLDGSPTARISVILSIKSSDILPFCPNSVGADFFFPADFGSNKIGLVRISTQLLVRKQKRTAWTTRIACRSFCRVPSFSSEQY